MHSSLGSKHLSELDFRALAENMPTLCWIANPDGYIVWYNRRMHEYTGKSASELEGWGWQSVHHPDTLPLVLERWRTSIAAGSPFEMTFPLRGADGNFRPFLTRIMPSRDASGAISAWYGVNTDISAQVEAERQLRLEQGFSDTILRSSRDCIVILDLEGRKLYVSPGAVEGMEIEDTAAVLGLSWLRLWEGEYHVAAEHAVHDAASGGIGRFRGVCATHKGKPKWWDVVVSPIAGADGAPERLLCIARDVTDKKRAEDYLLWSEARFRSLAQSMPNHVWTARKDGKLDWFNDRVYAYGGVEPGSLDGDKWAIMVHSDDLAPAAAAWTDAISTGERYEVEFRLRRADGMFRWHIGRAEPVRNPVGEIELWIGTNTDIHDQKAAEKALGELARDLETRVQERTRELEMRNEQLRQSQKMEAVGQLTGGIAHDFNNLLQVVSGNLQLLARDIAGNERAERRVSNALAGTSRGAKLANQLLAFSRRQPLEPKVVNIARFITSAEDMIRRAIGEAIEVEFVVAGGLWNTFIDPVQVENALLNLAINARDAMEGSGKLTIELGNALLDADYTRGHADVTPGQYVMLAVSDTGCGMTPEIMAQVFEPFFSTKPEGKGTGLGLSMVYGFVKQSGGHIKIYSEPGHGTTVKVYLPRATQAEDLVTIADIGLAAGGSETVLVVEDDEEVRTTVVDMLNDLGYRVLKAKDATAALHIIESGVPIDLLFTDVVMPGPLKCTELARKAKERLPGIRVLFTSGYTQNAIVHGGRLDPGVELLVKPYTREALARKIRLVLGIP